MFLYTPSFAQLCIVVVTPMRSPSRLQIAFNSTVLFSNIYFDSYNLPMMFNV
jgi:hypothetical protein